MKFKLYVICSTVNKYNEAIKPCKNIFNKYNFQEAEKHIDTFNSNNDWIQQNYKGAYAGTIELKDLKDLISLREELPKDLIIAPGNSLILYNDYIE